MTWTNPTLDLRTLLSDGTADKHRYRKRVFGEINGTNKSFKTFEFRRVTDFTTATSPLGIWKDGVYQGSAAVTSDNIETGDFVLVTAPADGSVLEASYYIQWFTDTEITNFLRLASNWLSLGDDYTVIGSGLRPACLKYAAAEAYQKLSLRWAEHLSENFLLNDAPDEKRMAVVEAYRKQALDYRKEAETVRDDYYSRSGQQKQPLFATSVGRVTDNVPRR